VRQGGRWTFEWWSGSDPCLAPTIGIRGLLLEWYCSSTVAQVKPRQPCTNCKARLSSLFQPPHASSVSVSVSVISVRCRRPSSQPQPLDRPPSLVQSPEAPQHASDFFSDGSNRGEAHGVAVCHRFNGSPSLISCEKSCARWHCQMSMFP
jgi:hypothetical protein